MMMLFHSPPAIRQEYNTLGRSRPYDPVLKLSHLMTVFSELVVTDVVKPYPARGGVLDLMSNVRQ